MPNPNKLALGKPNFTNQDFFVYSPGAVFAIAGGATSTQQIQIESDAEFLCTKLAYFVDIALAIQTDSTRVIPLITLQITDGGSSRNLFSSPQPLSSVAGEGDKPFMLPVPRVFRSNSTITLAFSNFSAATTYNVRFSMIGIKRW